ncbi:DNA topoisomerase IB [Flavobacterium sp.]|uniref:DNA topoisomerase IB n=1 Tax=Flavobacterium sp. TaxID=239 RepID=UPI0037500420
MDRLHAKLEKIGRNPLITAKAVGLQYCINCDKGYFRKRSKSNFHYTDENENLINDKEIMQRISKLLLPPAWENVWISPHENGHLQATGIDSKGRKQYRYHQHWNKIRNQSKFHRLLSFAKVLPSIRKEIEKDLNKKDLCHDKVVALVIKLIETTNIRIGNDVYKKLYGSFGLTTLQDKHVKFKNSNIQFEFVGKKGVKHKINIESKKLATLVKKFKDIPGQDLFQYYDASGNRHTVGSSDINQYLKKITDQDFTAKDFRAWSGSLNALSAFMEFKIPETQAETKQKIIEVVDEVASKLGNTRSVCKKYYIHPTVIAAYEKGKIWKYKSNKKTNYFQPQEFSLIKMLEKEKISEVLA